MKKKILCIMTLVFVAFTCAFGLSSCKEVYEVNQVDSLIANLQNSIDTNKLEQDKKIEEITLQYQAKDNELLLVIEGDKKVLLDFKTSYELALKELQDKDLAIDKAIEDLDTKYYQEVEKLLENDSENMARLEEIKTQHDGALKELQDKDLATDKAIEELVAKYYQEVEKLLENDNENMAKLEDLKTQYNSDLKELQDKDLAIDKAIEELDAKYYQEVEKLLENDSENLAKLEELKRQHDGALKELQDKDLAIDKAIEDLDTKYYQEVENLQNKINLVNQQIDNNKKEFETQIEAINVLYNVKIVEINNVIDMLKTTNNSQDDIISSLIDRVTNLESAMQIKEIMVTENGDLTIYFTNGTSQTVKKPQGHVHDFDEWIEFSSDETSCNKKLIYHICKDCDFIEWGKKDHEWSDNFSIDGTYHWKKCKNCQEITGREMHVVDEGLDLCLVCDNVMDFDGLFYEVVDGEAKIKFFNYYINEIKILDYYLGAPVKSIPSGFFVGDTRISKIIIPDTINEIGSLAFHGCESLVNIVFEGTVDEWNAIGYEDWFDVPATKVVCSDGEVPIESEESFN